MDAGRNAQVRVGVHEAGGDRLAGDVDLLRARRNGEGAARADGGNAVVGDDDVALLDDARATHGDDACAAQHGGRVRDVARCIEANARLHGLVGRQWRTSASSAATGGVARGIGCGGGAGRVGRAHRILEGDRARHVVHHVRIADGPVNAVAVTAPVRKLRADVRELSRRKCLTAGGRGIAATVSAPAPTPTPANGDRRLRAARPWDIGEVVQVRVQLGEHVLAVG